MQAAGIAARSGPMEGNIEFALRVVVSWIVLCADVFQRKRTKRRHLRNVFARFCPVEVSGIARQYDDASGWVRLRCGRVELVARSNVENTRNNRIDPVLRMFMRH